MKKKKSKHKRFPAFAGNDNRVSVSIVASLLLLLGAHIHAQQEPVNFLLLTADDMNWNSPGVYGSGVDDITPNIDKLASEGLRFMYGHVTAAICQPSRESLMTGRYPHNNGAPGFQAIADSVPTLQEQLHNAGYLNGILGKVTHLAPKRRFMWDLDYDQPDLGYGRDPNLYYQYAVEFFTMVKNQDKPFFLMANSHDPHRPFAGSRQEANQNWNPVPTVRRTYAEAEVEVPGFLPDIADVHEEIAQYYTSVHRSDETVGKVLQALDESGLADNTLVMFLSDNGMSFPYAKTNAYLHSNRTPWLARWPGKIEAGRVDTLHFINGIDFMPTILEVAGLEPVPKMNGRSFLPVLLGEQQGGLTRVFNEINTKAGNVPFPIRSVKNRRFGYIWNRWSDGQTEFKNESQSGLSWNAMVAAGGGDSAIEARVDFYSYRVPEEFYDFENDPDALHNLIDEPEYQDIIAELRQQLVNEMFMTGDSLLELFEDTYGVEGKAVKPGCMDDSYVEYDSSATESDPSYCMTLDVTVRYNDRHRDIIADVNAGVIEFSGQGGMDAELQMIGISGRNIRLTKTGPGRYMAGQKLKPGVYWILTGGMQFRIIMLEN